MARLDHKIPPPIIGVMIAAAMWASATVGPHLILSEWFQYSLTVSLVLIGLVFELAGVLAFRAHRTTVNPMSPERTTSVVTTGVYRFSRNPMYVGMSCLLLAFAAYLASLFSALGPVMFVYYITQFQIKPEERVLTSLFGDDYLRYLAKTRRWL
jgi:protein-S-isoprenylcysteine O-methyltransferase Ste14